MSAEQEIVPKVVPVVTPEQVRVINKTDLVFARYERLVAAVHSPFVTYISPDTAIPNTTFKKELISAGFARALVGLKLDAIDAGLDNDDDYQRLLKGDLAPPPVLEEPGIDKDGHKMLRRGQKGSAHWLCPLDGTVRWDTEV